MVITQIIYNLRNSKAKKVLTRIFISAQNIFINSKINIFIHYSNTQAL